MYTHKIQLVPRAWEREHNRQTAAGGLTFVTFHVKGKPGKSQGILKIEISMTDEVLGK